MLIKEYRITMPMTVSEYQIAQLYCVAEASKENTGNGEGIEVVKDESFENYPLMGHDFTKGRYTYKIYHLASKVPALVRSLLPATSLAVHEEAWNAFPYCRTIVSNPKGIGEKFKIVLESMHLDDNGTTENAHLLSLDNLARREVKVIDIANNECDENNYDPENDPKTFHSVLTGRGPLLANWKEEVTPTMTCYKLVTAEFRCFGLQTRVEDWVHRAEQNLFFQFHRKMFCSIDKWYGMTMDDVRRIEEATKEELLLRFNQESKGKGNFCVESL